jgi:AraC family transcriptional regulator of adaptative response / DNA-3-methyladenine glycosylase II
MRPLQRDIRKPSIPLDDAACERARLARDPGYDGRFFVAVKTTGIYCRPVCPAGPALAKNVRFFATAEEAKSAGFRACKRCRP